MAGISLIMNAVRLLKAGSRAAAKQTLKKAQPKASEKEINAALDAAKRGIVISDKTGMPISQLVKKGTTSQTIANRIAKYATEAGVTKGRVQGIVGTAGFGGAALGLDALVDSINKVTEGSADTKPASTPRRKSPEGGQTIKENRRVVSETRLAKGGMTKKKYSKGGALKKAPADAKGLKKLPTKVRNKMGYMAKGGAVKPASKSKKK